MLLDQYGAADIVIAEVDLRRGFPGGPALGTFTARFGPDGQVLGRFQLRAASSEELPRMLDEGVRRMDRVYRRALEAGLMQPDPSLVIIEPAVQQAIEETPEDRSADDTPAAQPAGGQTVNIQVETPDAAAVQNAEVSVSRVSGVTSAITTSLALGGTSVIRVTYSGDPAALQAALRAQGWTVSGSGTSLRISR